MKFSSKEWLEEGGGKGDCSQKKRWEVSSHHLTRDLPVHDDLHAYSFFPSSKGFVGQTPMYYSKDGHVQFLAHIKLVRD